MAIYCNTSASAWPRAGAQYSPCAADTIAPTVGVTGDFIMLHVDGSTDLYALDDEVSKASGASPCNPFPSDRIEGRGNSVADIFGAKAVSILN